MEPSATSIQPRLRSHLASRRPGSIESPWGRRVGWGSATGSTRSRRRGSGASRRWRDSIGDGATLYGRIPGQGLKPLGEFKARGHAEEVYARITGRPYLRAIKEGDRFKLVREVVRFPDFIARPGLTGTVTAVSGGIRGRIDEPVRGAEAWDNELHWDSLVEFVADTEPWE